MIEGLRC